jgi:hypothetical protein
MPQHFFSMPPSVLYVSILLLHLHLYFTSASLPLPLHRILPPLSDVLTTNIRLTALNLDFDL